MEKLGATGHAAVEKSEVAEDAGVGDAEVAEDG
jgi:hypothetical protein